MILSSSPPAEPPHAAALQPHGRLGRFELRRHIGESARAQVWLAWDPKTQSEVRLKWMQVGEGVPATTVAQWMQEARAVSHLQHPAILTVHELDTVDGRPLQISPYVPAQTLAMRMALKRPVPQQEAVAWIAQVLDALVVAHAATLVHGRLSPSNILVDNSGHVRIMDFSLPTRVDSANASDNAAADIQAAYRPPETIGDASLSAGADVYAAGRILAELLTGRDDMDLAPALAANMAVDESLSAIVMHALAADPSQRLPSARAFAQALESRVGQPAVPVRPGLAESMTGDDDALAVLIRRMQESSDFPAMSHSVARIQGMAGSDTESVAAVTREILKDVALSNKLLRIVNSAFYARGHRIATVSRAVSLVGLNTIRNMALGLVLLEHMQDKVHADLLTDEFLRALMAASIARELCPADREGEECFIGALFQDLGRLLAMLYFPDETVKALGLIDASGGSLSEHSASNRVLGVSFEAQGLGVAKMWDLPEDIRRYMRKPAGDPPRSPSDFPMRLRWTVVAANEMADTLLRRQGAERSAQLQTVCRRFTRAIDITADEMEQAAVRARVKLVEMVRAMNLRVVPGGLAARLLQAPDPGDAPTGDTLQGALESTLSADGDGKTDDGNAVGDMLAAGISDITHAMMDDYDLSDVVRMVLETMYRAMGFAHVVFCLRDPKADALTGRFGLGEHVDAIVKAFEVPLGAASRDLFHAVCMRGSDTMIGDATTPRVSDRLPQWYRATAPAPAFLLLPLMIKDKPFGLIYADFAEVRTLSLNEHELGQLRTLRNQAVMAFKQSH
jgi:HD-like signal output (HDOD) protein